jgi:hypothetical protein
MLPCVDATQRRHDQRTAAQALRVADGRNRDVDLLARLRERGEIRAHHHRGDVLQLRVCVRGDRDAVAHEHVLDALDRERRLARLVAGAVETDDEAVTHELVGTNALHGRDVLHPFGARDAADHHEQDGTEDRPDDGVERGESESAAIRFHGILRTVSWAS